VSKHICSSNVEFLHQLHSLVPVCTLCGSAAFNGCLKHPPISRWGDSRVRRGLEILFAFLVLIVFALPMLLIAACVRLSSKGESIFAQQRVGRCGQLFHILKFRSMAERQGKSTGPGLTKGGDRRITNFGRILRRFKLDELPQFINILRGDMSLVGPRPKLPKYAAIPNMPYRPGITGLATLAFRREEEILRSVDTGDMDDFYTEHIKPMKAKLDVCYMCKATPASDLRLIASTFFGCFIPESVPMMFAHTARAAKGGPTAKRSTVAEEQMGAD
jgi:lipopolysaccharide/colanic/teichoic acid biosynthesis glycosyltransferase